MSKIINDVVSEYEIPTTLRPATPEERAGLDRYIKSISVDVERNAIKKFATWCYMNGITFGYMVNNHDGITGNQWIENLIDRYYEEI